MKQANESDKRFRIAWRANEAKMILSYHDHPGVAIYELGRDHGYDECIDERWPDSSPRSWLERYNIFAEKWEAVELDFTE